MRQRRTFRAEQRVSISRPIAAPKACRGNSLGVVLTEGGFLLSRNPDTVRGPDVSFVRADRFNAEEAGRGYFRGAPDLAIEILSPSNRPGETHAKVADYLAAGTRLVWVIDPMQQIVSVYRSLLSPRRIAADGVLDGEDVLPEFSGSHRGLTEELTVPAVKNSVVRAARDACRSPPRGRSPWR